MRFYLVFALMSIFIVSAVSSLASEKRPFIFGINRVGGPWVLFHPPDYDEHIYQRVAEVGSTNVRLIASPREIESVRGQRDWSDFDRDVGLAIKYGVEPMVLIANTPAWASPTGEDTHMYPYKTELLPEFVDFCRELAERTKGKVKYFQIWNEQNGFGWHYFEGFNHADEYVPVLRAAYQGLKQGNPDCLVFLGGLCDGSGNAPIFMRLTYEERDKQFPGERIFDGVTTHPYSPDIDTMREKLDAVHQIMIDNGDGDLPLWITEYGWSSNYERDEYITENTKKFIEAFSRDDWSLLKGAISLSVADFEGRTGGFGVTDVNLRPKPNFAAFQGAPRFGASPPHSIKWRPLEADSMEVTWETVLPTTGRLHFMSQDGKRGRTVTSNTPDTEHRVVLIGLNPGTEYDFRITTRTEKWHTYTSFPQTIRALESQVFNGDFEQGFFGGIGRGWTITGAAFCTDMSLVPQAPKPIGKHAQAVYAYADKGHVIDSTFQTFAAVGLETDNTVKAKWSAEVRDADDARVLARMGVDATGGNNPGASSVTWTEWQSPGRSWGEVEMPVKAENSVVSIFIECRGEGDFGENGIALFYLDDVSISSH